MCRHGVGLYVLKSLFWPGNGMKREGLYSELLEVFIYEFERNNINRSFLPSIVVVQTPSLHPDNVICSPSLSH
jgi:hypothetical protein